MSILTSTNQSTSQAHTRTASVPNLRQTTAGDAPGFAQVLQAFDHDQDSTVIDSATDTDSPQGRADEHEAIDDAAKDDEASAAQGEKSESGGDAADSEEADEQGAAKGSEQDAQNGQGGDDDSGQSDSEASVNPSSGGEAPNTQAAQRDIAQGLELLNNKSDQAKISIRGLVKAIRADASQDATTLAVQTRLGTVNASNTKAENAAPAQPAPDQVRPLQSGTGQTGVGDAAYDPKGALSDEPPTSDRVKGENQRPTSEPGVHLRPASDVPAESTRSEAQQSRSVRADAASLTQPVKTGADSSRSQPLHSIAQADLKARADGAMTSRAVTGVEASGGRNSTDTSSVRAKEMPQPPSEGRQATQTKIVAQVQRGLASLMRSASGEMTVRLTPERLGELKIEMKRSGDQLSVRLTTQSSEASELLRSGTEELTQLLRTKGVNIERVHVEHQQADAGEQQSFDLGSNDADREQHETDRRPHGSTDQTEQADSVHLEPQDEPGTIWTELGLDAIA